MAWNGSDQTGRAASMTPPDSRARRARASRAPNQTIKQSKNQTILHGLLALVIIAALGGAAVWYFTRPAPPPPPAQNTKHKAQIASVTPAPARTNAVPAKPVDPWAGVPPKERYDHSKFYRDERGILRYMTGCRAPDPTRPKQKVVRQHSHERKIFENYIDRELATILTSGPGDHRLVEPDYDDPEFQADFMKALKERSKVKDDDIEYDRDLKNSVNAVKDELAQRVAAGENIGDILKGASKELARLTAYKEQLEDQVRRIIDDGDGKFSEADIHDVVNAANQMFEENGINPVDEDAFVEQNIRLVAKRAGKTEVEAEDDVAAYQKRREEEFAEKEAKENEKKEQQ